MSVTEQLTSTGSVFARSEQARTVLERNASATEKRGRPTDESIAAVSALGAFTLAVPRESGGIGADLASTARVLMTLGAGCTSTAWVVGTATTSSRFALLMQRDDTLPAVQWPQDATYCGSGAPTGRAVSGRDGVRVSGRWPIVSGAEVASEAVLGVMLVAGDEASPAYSAVRIRMSQLQIERTWDTAGLRGTGSHTVVADDVLVNPDDIGAVEPDGRFVIASSVDVLAPLVGAAQAALALVVGVFASSRKLAGQTASIGSSPGAQRLLADATRLVAGAQRRVLDVCDDFDTDERDAPLAGLRVSESRVQLATAAEEIRSALDKLLDLHGVSGFASGNPLQRLWRDVSVGTRHPLVKPYPIIGSYGSLVAAPTEGSH